MIQSVQLYGIAYLFLQLIVKSYVIELVILCIAIRESFFSPDGHRNVIKLIIIIFELTYIFNYKILL